MHYYFINLVILNYKILLTRDFCERNEGVLFSAFVSLIIILISVFGTYYFTNKSNNNKNRDKYTGLIQIIKTELVWNIINLNNLSKTLLVLKQRSIEAKSIVISDVNFKFDTSILESSLLNIIEYKKFNHEMAKYIDSLIHILKNINYNLDFSNANQALNITEKSEIEKKISDYFLVLEDKYIKKGIIIIKKIEKLSL